MNVINWLHRIVLQQLLCQINKSYGKAKPLQPYKFIKCNNMNVLLKQSKHVGSKRVLPY